MCSNKFPHSSPLVTDVPCRLTAWGWRTAELLSAKGKWHGLSKSWCPHLYNRDNNSPFFITWL